jgi:hypothetical protein
MIIFEVRLGEEMKSSRGCVVWFAAVDEVCEVRPGGDVRPRNKQWVQLGPGYSTRAPAKRGARRSDVDVNEIEGGENRLAAGTCKELIGDSQSHFLIPPNTTQTTRTVNDT